MVLSMIGTSTQCPPLGLEILCMKPQIEDHSGDPVARMSGIVVQNWTIIEIASFVCPKHVHIILLVHL